MKMHHKAHIRFMKCVRNAGKKLIIDDNSLRDNLTFCITNDVNSQCHTTLQYESEAIITVGLSWIRTLREFVIKLCTAIKLFFPHKRTAFQNWKRF
jgi:hypothetical protein